MPSALGTWHCSRSKKNGSASTSTQTTTATHPPKAPVAHQNAHQKRTSRPHTKAHTKSHTKPHISTAHDGTESRTPTETAHLKRTWGTSKVCSPKVWCSKAVCLFFCCFLCFLQSFGFGLLALPVLALGNFGPKQGCPQTLPSPMLTPFVWHRLR